MIVVIDTTIGHKKYLGKLLTYLRRRNAAFAVIRDLDGLRALPVPPSQIIISGSDLSAIDTRRLPPTLVALLDHVLRARAYRRTRILGICFGAQYIAAHLGVQMVHLSDGVAQRIDVHEMGIRPWFFVHDLPIQSTPMRAPIEVLGTATIGGWLGVIVAFRHKRRPMMGVLFHPEQMRSTYRVLDSFLTIAGGTCRR